MGLLDGIDLAAAGMISGAGSGAGQALTSAQGYIQTAMLQGERDKIDDMRAQRLMEHQERMQGKTITAGAAEGKLTREHQTALTETQIKAHATESGLTREATKENLGTQIGAQKEIAKEGNLTHIKVAEINMEAQKEIHRLDRTLKESQFDKTFTAAKLTALTNAQKDLSNQIIHLNTAVSSAMADKDSPEYKSAVQMLMKANRLHMEYHNAMAPYYGISDKIGAAQANPPGFKLDPSLGMRSPAAPVVAPTPGLIQTPLPSSDEQEMMQNALNP